MKLYLTGKITDADAVRQAHNLEVLDLGAARLRELGHDVVNPADRARLNPNASWAEHVAAELCDLVKSEGQAVLPSWSVSRGGVLETLVASVAGIPHYRAPDGTPLTIPFGFILERFAEVFDDYHRQDAKDGRKSKPPMDADGRR